MVGTTNCATTPVPFLAQQAQECIPDTQCTMTNVFFPTAQAVAGTRANNHLFHHLLQFHDRSLFRTEKKNELGRKMKSSSSTSLGHVHMHTVPFGLPQHSPITTPPTYTSNRSGHQLGLTARNSWDDLNQGDGRLVIRHDANPETEHAQHRAIEATQPVFDESEPPRPLAHHDQSMQTRNRGNPMPETPLKMHLLHLVLVDATRLENKKSALLPDSNSANRPLGSPNNGQRTTHG